MPRPRRAERALPDPAGHGAVLLAGERLDFVAVGGGRDAGLVDAAAHQVLADGDDALLGELLVDVGGAGLLVGVAVQLDLGVRGVAQEADEAVERVHLVLADHGLVQVEEDVHVGALVDGLFSGLDVLRRIVGHLTLGTGRSGFRTLVGRGGGGSRGGLGLAGTPAEVEGQTAEEGEVDIGTGRDLGIVPGVEGLGIELGVELEVEGDPVAQADIRADTAARVPEELDGLPEVLEVLAGRGQFVRPVVLQADGAAGSEEGIDGDRTVGTIAEQAGTPVKDDVQVGLDILESVEVTVLGGVLGLPAVHGESEGPAVDEAVADGNLGCRREELGEVRMAEVIGCAALNLDVRLRRELLRRCADGEGREKGQDKGYFFHIGVLKDFHINGKDNKKSAK